MRQKFLALTGTKGNGTMSSVAISVRGKVREEGPSRLDELLEHNPYMYDIYPTPASREVLTVFKVYEGTGEWFDLSVKPIDRASFAFGGATEAAHGYFVNAASCIGCGACLPVCPQQCIALANGVAAIDQAHCLHCGRCANICPANAIERR